MARKYCDYIQIAEDFIPFYTEDKDKTYPNRWKSFYPHETFVELVRAVVGSVEGARDEHRKSIWLRGSYGTGKTYAAFTIKHLLEDSKEDVDSYFAKNVQLSEILHNKIDNIKNKGKILVATYSGSAHITNDNLLFYTISEAIRKELKTQGHTYMGQRSQYDSVVESLNDDIFKTTFPKLFEKYQDRFLEFPDCDYLMKKLPLMESASEDTARIVADIVDIYSSEGIHRFMTTPTALCAWVNDVRKGNNLQSIMLIWDEFTNFFENNATKTSGLQEIAQRSGETNFYLILVTHKSANQFALDNNTAKILEARFKQVQLEMANTTAYTFMAQSLDVNPIFETEWKHERSRLWDLISNVAESSIFDFSETKEEDIKKLLPMHPYSVYLLKQISEQMSSNQRTMYLYLSSDSEDENQRNFRWFIKNNSSEDWRFLTADYIWDYFFDLDNVAMSDDLSEKCKININHFNNYKDSCDNDEQRKVLKVVLMLDAINTGISRKASTRLLQASLKNVITAFEGTPIKENIRFILSKLESKGIIGNIDNGNGDIIYITRSTSVNEDQFNELRKGVEREWNFENLILNTKINIIDSYSVPELLRDRFFEIKATYSNVKKKIEEYKQSDKFKDSSMVPLVFVFAKNQQEAVETPNIIKAIRQNYAGEIVIIDVSNKPFGDDRYNKFVDKMTYVKYCMTTHDNSQIGIYQQDADKILRTWKSDLDAVKMLITSEKDTTTEVTGISKFAPELRDINKKLFPFALEVHFSNSSMFKSLGNKEVVPRMGMGVAEIISNYRYLDEIKNSLMKNNAWNNSGFENLNPDYFVSKIKLMLNAIISASFAKNESLSLLDIWSELKKKPYGFMDNVASGFVIGFLLKEFADSGYYKRDGQKTPEPLTNDQLANMIIACIVSPKKIENVVIRKRTEEQEKFCEISSKAFKLSKNIDTVEQVYSDIRTWLTDSVNFPLWGLIYHINNTEDKFGLNETIKKIIKLYCDFVTPSKTDGQDDNKIISQIVKLVKSDSGVEKYLCDILSKDNIKDGIACYVAEVSPELGMQAKKLGLDNIYLDNIRNKFRDYTWLWDENDIKDQINEVALEYKIIAEVKKIYPKSIASISDAYSVLKDKVGSLKMPYPYFREKVVDISELFDYLKLIYVSDTKNIDKQKLLTVLIKGVASFANFCDNQSTYFADICVTEIDKDFSKQDAETIFEQMSSNQFNVSYEPYVQGLKSKIVSFARSKKLDQVVNLWVKTTKTNTPREWCETNSMPIIFLFGQYHVQAKNAFEIINNKRADLLPAQYDQAKEFLSDDKIKILNDSKTCNKKFVEEFAGDYAHIFVDEEQFKKRLRSVMLSNPYEWADIPGQVQNVVKKYAEELYKTMQEKVRARVEKMQEKEAKQYLLELIKNEPTIGIKLLKE